MANLHEKCGVFGIYCPGEDVSRITFFGLYALQHRGQESAGIATADGKKIQFCGDMGLVSQVFDEDSASMFVIATSILAPLTRRWADRLVKRRLEREAKYDLMDPASQDFLREDRHNFRILKRDIFKVEVDKKSRTLWTGGLSVSGILHLTTTDMRTRRFILVAGQDTYSVRAMI